uniref:Uncharacterized protein n=1 Tax=Arundo donax TaxID=35708 RepID=A0A0A9FKF7_ARUDO
MAWGKKSLVRDERVAAVECLQDPGDAANLAVHLRPPLLPKRLQVLGRHLRPPSLLASRNREQSRGETKKSRNAGGCPLASRSRAPPVSRRRWTGDACASGRDAGASVSINIRKATTASHSQSPAPAPASRMARSCTGIKYLSPLLAPFSSSYGREELPQEKEGKGRRPAESADGGAYDFAFVNWE